MKLRTIILSMITMLLLACSNKDYVNPADPYEGYNRKVYQFNKTTDEYVLRPITIVYDTIMPEFMDTGIKNAFSNIGEIPTVANDLLQGKFKQAGSDTFRFLVNTTLGIAGLFDVASKMGVEKHEEDFGQTLGYWGIDSGSYLMLPFLGPSTTRDLVGTIVDTQTDPLQQIDHVKTKNTTNALNLITTRHELLKYEGLLEEAFDEYAFLRDTYLQKREAAVNDSAKQKMQETAPVDDVEGEDEFSDDTSEKDACSSSAEDEFC